MRSNYISWEEYFFRIAYVSSLRSKDPSSQNGAVIVNNENIIIGVGYNGLIKGIKDTPDIWTREVKYPYVVHAEQNAIDNVQLKNQLKDSQLYLYSSKNFLPCTECAKRIAHNGIKVVNILGYPDKHDVYNWTETEEIMKKTNIQLKVHQINLNYLQI